MHSFERAPTFAPDRTTSSDSVRLFGRGSGGAGAGRRGRRAAWQVVIRRPERRQHRRRLVFWLELGWKRRGSRLEVILTPKSRRVKL